MNIRVVHSPSLPVQFERINIKKLLLNIPFYLNKEQTQSKLLRG